MGAEQEPAKAEEKKEEEIKKQEEEKKPEEEEKKTEDSTESKDPPPPPPPEDIVLKVFMHCEGCAKKVRRCLKGFDGVEEVETNCKVSLVTVKGKNADPLKVLDRVQRKSHRQVELISPIPKPEDEKKVEEENKENVKPEEEKKEEEVIITVVVKVHMHCEACAQEIQKRIVRMKGVKTAEADLKSSQVTVKGVFDPPKLVEYIYKRTGKHAFIVNTEPEKKVEEEKGKEENAEKKEDAGGEKPAEEEKKEGEEAAKPAPAEEEAKKPEEPETAKVEASELKKNEFYYYPPKYTMEYTYPPKYTMEHAYPPQIFSDENPNACSVM